MKLTINAAALRSATELAIRALPTRPVNPIVSCLALTSKDGQLTIRATDFDSWLRASYPADVQTESEVVVPGRVLAAAAAAMPVGDVDLVCEQGTLVVSGAGRARCTLPTRPAEDFPAWPVAPDGALRRLSGPAFATALDACARIATNAPTAQAHVHRVILDPIDGGMRMFGTDSYRLVAYDLAWSEPGQGDLPGVALDPGTVGPMVALAKACDQITLAFPAAYGSGRFELGAGSARAVAAVLGGDGITFERCMSQVRRERAAIVDSRDLLDLAGKVTPFGTGNATDKARPVAVITLDDGELGLAAGDDESGSMADTIPTDGWSGEVWRSGVNPSYLLDTVKALPAGALQLTVGPPNRPLLITPADQDPPVAQALLMPVRLPEETR